MATAATDDKLIKRAGYGGRNVTGLAILATLLAAVVALAAGFAKSADDVAVMLVPFPTIALAYWLLALAAHRGNPRALNIVLGCLAGQFLFSLVAMVIAQVFTGGTVTTSLLGIIIPLVVIAVLARNRADLLELQRRGLWDGIFGDMPLSNRLCALGGILLVVGLVALYALLFLSAVHAGTNGRLRREFMDLITVDEKNFIDAVTAAGAANDGDAVVQLLTMANELEAKTKAIAAQARTNSEMHGVASKYGEAVGKWQSALRVLGKEGGADPRVQALFAEGDQLRQQAITVLSEKAAPQKN